MTDHYFSEKQESPLKETVIKAVIRNRQFTFITGSGVFSKKKVDIGSILLINNCLIEEGWKVLDLGCGYGPVGITLASLFPSCEFLMTDINERALKLTRKNAQRYGLKNVETRKSDGLENIKDKFDTILLNPPQTAGKKLCEKMIRESREHLRPKGCLQIVARHQKGGKSLSEYMEKTYGNVEVLAKGSGFRIYCSRNP